MLNVILFILGYFLTRKDRGKSGRPDDNDSSGSGSGVSSKTWDRIVLGGLAVAAYLVFRNSFNKYTQQQAFENIASNPNALIAQQFRTAFQPYGTIFGWEPGTDTDTILNLAPTITQWKEVISSYQQLYNESLTDRLQKELSPADLVKFYSLLGKGTVSASAPATVGGTTAATPGAKPSTGKFSLPGLKDITGQNVIMLSGTSAIFRDSDGKVTETILPGQRLGEGVGWAKVNGVINVVYYKTAWEKLIFSERYIAASKVRLS